VIEGGRQTLQTFIDANLWDEARVFKGTIHLKEGNEGSNTKRILFGKHAIGQDELIIFRNHD
jgi:diaminohydroxyphosphoribosylaminopyrimidine deaminase/5-amino-6-(5-phosphoribosylamino)uracil reductase